MAHHKRKRPKNRRANRSPRDAEITIKPVTDDYIRNMAGMAGTKGKLLEVLMAAKTKEREL
jgi:hypothetical protein